jgi:hypothetical protein
MLPPTWPFLAVQARLIFICFFCYPLYLLVFYYTLLENSSDHWPKTPWRCRDSVFIHYQSREGPELEVSLTSIHNYVMRSRYLSSISSTLFLPPERNMALTRCVGTSGTGLARTLMDTEQLTPSSKTATADMDQPTPANRTANTDQRGLPNKMATDTSTEQCQLACGLSLYMQCITEIIT